MGDLATILADHDRRVTGLLESNNRYLERARKAEADNIRLNDALKKNGRPFSPEFSAAVVGGQAKLIDELYEQLRNERVLRQETEAALAAAIETIKGLTASEAAA